MRIALLNPNTSAATTAAMVEIAQEEAGERAIITGHTARFGAPLIVEPDALRVAGEAVAALAPELEEADGVIVAAFGDPGLEALRARLEAPVTGIAEAAMAEAARGGRRFAVATTTPSLCDHIAETVARYGHTSFAGVWTTPGDPAALTADADRLADALRSACLEAIAAGAQAIIIGGGPLARAARTLAGTIGVPLVEPVPAAVRLSLQRLSTKVTP